MMISGFASSALDCEFEPQSGQTKDYDTNISYSSSEQVALRSMSKDWLAWNHDNLSDWSVCLPAICSFSEIALYKSESKRWSGKKLTSISHQSVT